ncbi:MAG: hypothetical protein H7Z19_15760, partial [Chitinophagaceae bacterium]|nr:hypothetical protein [Rubrivivax sp.]
MQRRGRSIEQDDLGLQERRGWAWLALALLGLAATLLWGHLSRQAAAEAEERARLDGQARVVELNLMRQLQGAYAAMRDVRDDLGVGTVPAGYADARLRMLQRASPGVRKINLLDAAGRVQASSLADDVGTDLSSQPALSRARARPDAQLLYVSEPARSGPTGFAIDLALVRQAPGGGFGGLLQVTFDADYFQTLLASVRYASDMRASVAHGDGVVILVDPPDPTGPGTNVLRPGSLFKAHRDSGAASSVATGRAVLGGDLRMVALRTLQAATL